MKKFFLFNAIFCISVLTHSQVLEQFSSSNIGQSYTNGTFTGNDNITWHYVNARGNQQITKNKNEAISLNKSDDACFYTDTISYGINQLSFLYEQTLSTDCDFNVFINDSCVASITTNNEKGITKECIIDITYENPFVLTFKQNSAKSGQVTFDDIYIKYNHTPFIINSINYDNSSITLLFSHKLSSIYCTCETSEFSFVFSQNICTISYPDNLCGRHSFTVSNIMDSANNQLTDTTITHSFTKQPHLNDVVFSEIMTNPNPSIGLPEYEYIELYNRSDCPIQCSDFELIINDKTYSLPDSIIYPNNYILLISAQAQDEFSHYTNICFCQNFPRLNDTEDELALRCNDTIISFISYDEPWFDDDFKARGGWSLEKIDVDNCSETKDNWNFSHSRTGGTPTKTNSIERTNQDAKSPTISSLSIVSDSCITISFSENIDCLYWIKQIKIDDIDCISAYTYNSLNNINLTFKQKLEKNKPYTIHIPNNCTDFAGNQFEDSLYIVAVTDSLLRYNDVIINEILFNPTTGNSDFIELYNNSEKFFDLSCIYISNGNSFVQCASQFLLFPPNSYATISADADNYVSICQCEDGIFSTAKLPSFPDESGIVLVWNKWEETIDSVYYEESWHESSLQSFDGVSLERLSPTATSTNASSWCSAAESSGFATPGCPNSHAMHEKSYSICSLSTEVFSPNNDDENSNLVISYGDIEQGTTSTIRIFTSAGHLVKQLTNNQLLGDNDTTTWDGTNTKGNVVSAGIYLISIELFNDGKRIKHEMKSCTILD